MKRTAKRTSLAVALTAALLASACRSSGTTATASPVAALRDLPGLEVKGPRSRANVVANLRPVLARMRELYEERRRIDPDLAGRIEVYITVEWNGEVGAIELRESTFGDPALEDALLLPVGYTDFDSWGRCVEDTEIVWPITFGEPE